MDSQVEAADMLYEQSFTRLAGGSMWHFSGAGEKASAMQNPDASPQQSSPFDDLYHLNQSQAFLDAAIREVIQLKKVVFSQWWRYVSDDDQSATMQQRKDTIKDLADKITSLQSVIDPLQKSIE